MKTLRPFNHLLPCTLLILAISFLTTCQKEITTPQKIVAQAQNYFETKVLTDISQKVYDTNPRHSVAKEPLWAEASVQNMPFGQAVVVPLVYEQAIALQTQSGNIPLGELSYLLIYKDAQKQYHTEVITKLPEKNYWPNYKNPNIPFKGVILVEDWWGNTLKNIGLGINGPENLLGYVAPKAKGQIPPNNNLMSAEQHCYNQYWTITVCNMEGASCVTVHGMDPVCFTVYTDNGGGGGGGGGNWSGLPTGPDYGNMPHGGAGGYNTPPPPPPNYLADITNNVTNPCLKAVVQNLKLANMTGKIGQIITALDKNTKVQIKVVDAQEVYNDKGESIPAHFDPDQGLVNGNFSGTLKISISTLLSSTKEYSTAVIIHEIVHAYLKYTNPLNTWDKPMEHTIISDKYITPMANYLSGLYTIPVKDATALAWSGLSDSAIYNSLPNFAYPSGTMTKAELGDISRDYIMKYSGQPVCNIDEE